MEQRGWVFDVSENDGQWFDYRDGARVRIRVLPSEETQKINKEVSKHRVDYKSDPKTGQMHRLPYIEIDNDLRNELTWNAVIVDWEGIYTKDGPMICTKENKIMLMSKSVEFAEFVLDCLKKLTGATDEQVEDERKN